MADTRSGFVALIGEPNAGKSTLVNRMVGSKVSIVTHKPQTTRLRVRGIALVDSTQIVFIDTPGLFAPRKKLDRAMVASAWRSADEADVVLLVAQAQSGLTEESAAILDELRNRSSDRKRLVLAINKIDLVRPETLLGVTDSFIRHGEFDAVFMISAKTGSGVDDLCTWLAANLPEGPWHYLEDQIADLPMHIIAAETTREKLMLRLHQELPYQLNVETDGWKNLGDGSIRIDQTVHVARESHKRIVLGAGGSAIKQVGAAARKELEQSLGCTVHLFIRVKSRPRGAGDAGLYEGTGLERGNIPRTGGR